MSSSSSSLFFPPICDTPTIQGFTWSQGFLATDDSVTIKIFLLNNNETENIQESDFQVSISEKDDQTLEITQNEKTLLRWRLFSKVKVPCSKNKNLFTLSTTAGNNFESPSFLEINLLKKEHENWSYLRHEKLSDIDSSLLLLPVEKIDEIYTRVEIPALPSSSFLEDTTKSFENLFTSLSPEHSQKLIKERINVQVKAFDAEFKALQQAAVAYKDSGDENTISLIQKLLDVVNEKQKVRTTTCPVTLKSLIRVYELEIQKMLLNTEGVEEETEEFFEEEERKMTGEEMYSKAIKLLLSSSQEEKEKEENTKQALHLLRLASLHRNHELSTLTLHQNVYFPTLSTDTASSKRRSPPKAAFFLLRHALLDNIENEDHEKNEFSNALTNRLVSDLISPFNSSSSPSSYPPFFAGGSASPLVSLSIYFSQRAAKQGDAVSMLKLAQMFHHGSAKKQLSVEEDDEYEREEEENSSSSSNEETKIERQMQQRFKDRQRSEKFLQACLDRGLPQAYLMKTILHLRENNKKKEEGKDGENYLMAKKYFDLLRRVDINEALAVGTGLFEDVKY